MKKIITGFVMGVVFGVSVTFLFLHNQPAPTLTKLLADKGVTPETISKLVIQGDESSMTTGVTVEIPDRGAWEWIWSQMIETAEPYSFWLSSGNRILHFYVTGQKDRPAATLYVNETDSSYLNDSEQRFMCRGLEQLLVAELTKKKLSNGVDLTRPERSGDDFTE